MHKLGTSLYCYAKNIQKSWLRSNKVQVLNCWEQRCSYTSLLQQDYLQIGVSSVQNSLILARNVQDMSKLACLVQGNCYGLKQSRGIVLHCFNYGVGNYIHLSRNFLAQLWIAEMKMRKYREKRRRKVFKCKKTGEKVYNNPSSFQHVRTRWFAGAAVPDKKHYELGDKNLKQPPVCQFISGFLEPTSREEVQVAPLVTRSNLLITRDIEWANLVLGFEQENRYAIVDVCYPQAPVGFIREQSNIVARQLLRLRRPFVAYVTDAMGAELFRVRRPFWWLTSSIYVEVDGKEVGVVHGRWHLWKRIYDLYFGNKQFAVVENPGFWNWTFTLMDIDGEVLAQIDRDWRGFGFEIFTDAGQYVIRFGSGDPSSSSHTGVIQELEVKRPLTLSERVVVIALAISLDNDYFSRHGGWGIPFIAVDQ